MRFLVFLSLIAFKTAAQLASVMRELNNDIKLNTSSLRKCVGVCLFLWFFSIICSFLPCFLLAKTKEKGAQLWSTPLSRGTPSQENSALTKFQSTPSLAKIMLIIFKLSDFLRSVPEWPESSLIFYPRQFWWEAELWEQWDDNESHLPPVRNWLWLLVFAISRYKILFSTLHVLFQKLTWNILLTEKTNSAMSEQKL